MSHYVLVNRTEKRKKRKKRLRKAAAVLVAVFILAVAVALWVYWRSMTPTILDIAQVRVSSESTRAINEAVVVAMRDFDYQNLVTISRDEDVVFVSANSIAVNNLARNTALITQSKICSTFQQSVKIPIGTLSGIPLLSELGPNVELQVSPIGKVDCQLVSKFETAGINQTLHRIYLNVDSRVDIVLPTKHQVVEMTTPVLICETVIVGKVPETFLQGGLLLGST